MATKKQIAANRRNSQKSTGPKSEEGKAAVSQNSVKHGLCGHFRVLPHEDEQQFDELLSQFRSAEKPVDRVEDELVLRMARHAWMSARAIQLQSACFLVQEPDNAAQKAAGAKGVSVRSADLELHIRYQVQNDRAYQRAAKELRERRKERRLLEIGFAREKRAEAEEARKQAQESRKQSEEIRKAEKHAAAIATADLRKQCLEMKVGAEIAGMLPPNVDLNSLNALFSAAAPYAPTPALQRK